MTRILTTILATILIISCDPSSHQNLQKTSLDDGKIEFIILQVNDIYEISPLEGGKVGGMARLATLKKQLLAQNPNTFLVHAGDFMNPSLMGTLKYNGSRLRGQQMIEVMNQIGFDLVTFGNHEFDLKEKDLQKRLNESQFEYIATNVQQRCGERLYPFYSEKNGHKHFYPETVTWHISDSDGTSLKIGFFSATIDSNPKDWIYYENPEKEAQSAIKSLQKSTDIILGLTHLNIEQDMELAKKFQSIPLIMGGHEHDNMHHEVGNCVVTKADANAKTAYVHTIIYDKNIKKTQLKSKLVHLDENFSFDPQANQVVQKWEKILSEKISEIVANPTEVIYIAKTPFDGRESSIRNKQTNLGDLITNAMLAASRSGAAAAILNSGSIRIDDQIGGNITPIDLFRAMPFGGEIWEVEMTGALLIKVLDEGRTNKGKGGFLQIKNLNYSDKNQKWFINNNEINPTKNYTIALSDYLMKGYDIKVLHEKAEGVVKI